MEKLENGSTANYLFIPKQISFKLASDKFKIGEIELSTPSDVEKAFSAMNSERSENGSNFYDFDKYFNTFDYSSFRDSKSVRSSLLADGEIIKKVSKIESDWRVMEIAELGKPKKAIRLVYVTPSGEGYISYDFDTFKKKQVPKEYYLSDSDENPQNFEILDEKYFSDENSDREFVDKYYKMCQDKLSEMMEMYKEVDPFYVQFKIMLDSNETKYNEMYSKKFQ